MNTTTRPTLDVYHLPPHAFDARSPLWWGNMLLMFIETVTVVLLFASYYYLRRNFDEWPPPQTLTIPAMVKPMPSLGFSTVNLILLIVSCLPMYWTDMAARRLDVRKVRLGLGLMVLLSVVSAVLRWYEFDGLKFRWDDNAYGSLVWTILGLHFLYILSSVVELALMETWALLHGLDAKHASDITLIGGFWYWTVAAWLPLYFTVYLYPRLG